MKRKRAAILLSIVLGFSLLNGCGQTDKNKDVDAKLSQDQESENAVYGQVSGISKDSITIEIGVQKQRERPQTEGTKEENSEETKEKETEEAKQGPKMFSALELTGEEQQIKITKDTVIQRQTMGSGPAGAPGNGGQKESSEKAQEQERGAQNPSAGEEGETIKTPGDKEGGIPQKPEGEEGGVPQRPEGEEGGIPQRPKGEEGEIPQKPKGEEGAPLEITISDISQGDTIKAVLAKDGSAKEITVMSETGAGKGMDFAAQPDNYVSVKEYAEDVQAEGENIVSQGTDENAVLISKGNAELKNITISRTSEDSAGGDQASFYGVGAAVLATDGSAYISGGEIQTDASGGAGIFAYGNGTVYASDTSIVTQKDTSGGVHAAGGGSLYAWDLQVETNGESAAAIRSDRGGGTMVIDGGTYVSNGKGSPAVYSTADIAISHADLSANGSEAVCIEGRNSLRLYDSNLSGNMGEDERNDCVWNVILYQSMSGDSQVGNSIFEMQGGTLKARQGGMFYTTNTESTITLSEVEIENASNSAFFLKCTGNQNERGWGTLGSNGADCLFTAINQEMEGNVIWDSISQLNFYMKENSRLKGAVLQDESCAGNGGQGGCSLYLSQGCVWTVTGDSVLTNLSSEGMIVDEQGRTVTIQGSDGKAFVQGDSAYTITVESYSDSADFSEASETTEWTEYQVQKPAQFV